jgi:putative PIN family toxin of toxin-antitoxin system
MRPDARPRVFLDSNVIVSALYSAEGAPAAILRRFIDGKLRVVISQQVLEEVVRTINEKLPEALPSLRKLLLSAPPEIVEDPGSHDVSRWAGVVHSDDAGILAAAVAAQPDYLVTGDKNFLEGPGVADKSGLRIVAPARFLERLEEDTQTS